MPNNVKTYDETGDPKDHLKVFQASAQVERWAMPTWCHMFNSTLIGAAKMKHVKDPVEIHNIKQKDGDNDKGIPGAFKDRDKQKNGKKEAPAKEKVAAIYMIQLWHRVTQQKVTLSFAQVNEITFPLLFANKGTDSPLVIEAEIKGHAIHRMYVDKGSSMEVLYEHCFNWLLPKIKSQMVPATTSLTGFSGETIWPLGQLSGGVGVCGGLEGCWSPSSYNDIIRRPSIREFQAVPSTAHGMLKFPVDGGVVTIRSTILTPNECATITETSKDSTKKIEGGQKNLKIYLHGHLRHDRGTTADSRTQTQYLGRIPPGLTEKEGPGSGTSQGHPGRGTKASKSRDYARSLLHTMVILTQVMVKSINAAGRNVRRLHESKQGLSAGLLTALSEIDWKGRNPFNGYYPFKFS
ncbi:hypothetical protein Tco_1282522 [Tanacetum coccineum]